MEEYPSLVEGFGLENREVQKCARGFESLFLHHLFKNAFVFINIIKFTNKFVRGMEQLVARQAHNLKVVGSSPTPATNGLVV